MTPRLLAAVSALLLSAACARPLATPSVPPSGPGPEAAPALWGGADPLPPVPAVVGPLALRVVYPAPTDRVEAGDSSFIFGSTGSGDARLTINGAPVRVWPNGAWLAWVALPPDSLMVFNLRAETPRDTATLAYPVRRAPRFQAPPAPVWIDSTSLSPQGRVWWPAGEFLSVSVRAAEGAEVRLRLADGSVVPLVAQAGYSDVPWGIRAFDRDSANLNVPRRADRYRGVLRGRALGRDPGPLFGAADSLSPGCPRTPRPAGCRRRAAEGADTAGAWLEAIRGADTVRVRWTVRLALLDSLPIVVRLDDDTAGAGDTDRLTVGRAAPGATYNWFFPTETRAMVSGRINGDLRLRLSAGAVAWVPAGDAHPEPVGRPALSATVGSVSLTSSADGAVLRIPLSQQVPFQVAESESGVTLRLYGAVGDLNWMRYGSDDDLVRSLSWAQAAADEVTLTVELQQPLWGYRTRWHRGDLLLELRRPPDIDRRHPLRGRVIAVDAGHPPLGATGPTGLREAEANLAVALRLQTMLEDEGARVLMTRTSDSAVGLWPRVALAESLGAEVLISIHNNALPDGVNPFPNNGTSVFYNHLPSVPLAREVQRALVRRLGLRDLGIARGDLALVRPTWFPAILTEGLFMMVPEQEAALRHPEGQERYARGVKDGLERFLRYRVSRE